MQTSFLVGYFCHKVICLCFWLLWRDNFAEHLLINRSHKPDTPTKVSCLLLPSRALLGLLMHPRWYLFFAILLIGSPRENKLFKIRIICVKHIIFKIRIICGISFDNFASSFDLSTRPIGKLFKIRIICGISFDIFASSFFLVSQLENGGWWLPS